MNLISTRDNSVTIDALAAVLQGISAEGGLFVPETFPELSMESLLAMRNLGYAEIAAKVINLFFGLPEEEMEQLTQEAYASFDSRQVVPIAKIGKQEFILELFHGPTLAFKDMALQVLPRLMAKAIDQYAPEEQVLILTATSGDTGKAALEGFKNVPKTRIDVFYPKDGVSDMQRLQMVTQEGENTYVAGVEGNFDDVQTGVKKIFGDATMGANLKRRGVRLSSANSINFGRLCPQIAYYVYGYVRLLADGCIQPGTAINIVVPTGNFGNILAAYYAKRMGLPVHKLICASNINNVLTDFFDSGQYLANRTFFKTISPSMDILISSNLERLLFEMMGRNGMEVAHLMQNLMQDGKYVIGKDAFEELNHQFYASYADELKTKTAIDHMMKTYGYLMDPHTAVAQSVYEEYLEHAGDCTPTLLASTASPFKFSKDVLSAISGETVEEPFQAAERLAAVAGISLPRQILQLKTAKERFLDAISKEELPNAVLSHLR